MYIEGEFGEDGYLASLDDWRGAKRRAVRTPTGPKLGPFEHPYLASERSALGSFEYPVGANTRVSMMDCLLLLLLGAKPQEAKLRRAGRNERGNRCVPARRARIALLSRCERSQFATQHVDF